MKTALTILVLLVFLAGAVWVGHYGWVSAGDVVMPAWGWLMLGLGVFFTLLVGGGLMALVFYGSREGFDEPPELAQKKKRRAAKWAKLVPTPQAAGWPTSTSGGLRASGKWRNQGYSASQMGWRFSSFWHLVSSY